MEPVEAESKRPKGAFALFSPLLLVLSLAILEPAHLPRFADTPFRQQRLRACQPILTPLVVISIFLGVGIIMFTLGFVMWHYNSKVVEVVVRYDNSPSCTS